MCFLGSVLITVLDFLIDAIDSYCNILDALFLFDESNVFKCRVLSKFDSSWVIISMLSAGKILGLTISEFLTPFVIFFFGLSLTALPSFAFYGDFFYCALLTFSPFPKLSLIIILS